MGWETRRGQRVYYRKERDGARVRSIYCGSGERGERAAREDEERRAASRKAPDEMLRNAELQGRDLSISGVEEKLEKTRTLSAGVVEGLNIGAASVTAQSQASYPEAFASEDLTKLNISGAEKTRTLAARPMVTPRPSSPLRVMGRPVGAAPRPRNLEEWRRAARRLSS